MLGHRAAVMHRNPVVDGEDREGVRSDRVRLVACIMCGVWDGVVWGTTRSVDNVDTAC